MASGSLRIKQAVHSFEFFYFYNITYGEPYTVAVSFNINSVSCLNAVHTGHLKDPVIIPHTEIP